MKYTISLLLSILMFNVQAQTNTFPASGNVGVNTTNPLTPLHVTGGPTITAGWSKTSTLQAIYPIQLFNSNSTKWAGIGYDFSTAMRFWVNSPNEDLPAYGTHGLTIMNDGRIGVGTGNPKTLLHLHQPSNYDAYLHLTNESTGSQIADGLEISANNNLGANIWNYENSYLRFATNNSEKMIITANGNVGISTTSPTEKLSVNGNIRAKKLIVTQQNWSDYVFYKGYKLRPLQEVEKYIQQHQHLPEVPSAKEVQAIGISLGDTQALLLKKIEELTLYIINQEKRIIQLEKNKDISKTRSK